MKTAIYDEPTATLAAKRAALAAQDAREREDRLGVARQREEARFVEAERIAATFGRLLRRQTAHPQAAPTPLHQGRGEGEQATQRRDAA